MSDATSRLASASDSTDAVEATHETPEIETAFRPERKTNPRSLRASAGPDAGLCAHRQAAGGDLMDRNETKRAALPLAHTTAGGVIEGYASLFGVADTGGDIVMAGAFMRSLVRRGASGVKMLWQHNPAEPIGVWTSLAEDAKGIKVSGRLDLSVARAREALSLIRGGAVDGLSIGFRAKAATTDRKSGLRRLTEIDLWEISVVTFPMLTQARISAVKRTPIQTNGAREAVYARLKMQEAALRFQHRLQLLQSSAR
jgi:HK97 family phage prohead protease